MGLHFIRFKLTHISHHDRYNFLQVIQEAISFCCQKHEKSHWPIAISIDIPNCIIRTGVLKEVFVLSHVVKISVENVAYILRNFNIYEVNMFYDHLQ